jgi:hypothetical protein
MHTTCPPHIIPVEVIILLITMVLLIQHQQEVLGRVHILKLPVMHFPQPYATSPHPHRSKYFP